MSFASSPERGVIRRIVHAVHSVSLFVKILGIGAFIAVVFGTVTLAQTRQEMELLLGRLLEARTRAAAQALAATLERAATTNDIFTLERALHGVMQERPDVRYVIVRDHRGGVVAHTFPNGIPPDLAGSPFERASEDGFRVLDSDEGRLFEASHSMADGHAGSVQYAMRDRMAVEEVARLTRSFLWALGFCTVVGIAAGLGLTRVLVSPVRHLEDVARSLGSGDFSARAEVFADDEIGHLALAVNRMANSLQEYDRQVVEKEEARLALLKRTVNAQEAERRSISRELHDQLGQSILAALLVLQDKPVGMTPEQCSDLEVRLRAIAEETRRLASGMRPSILDDYGLDSALTRLVGDVALHADLELDYQYTAPPGAGRLPDHVETTLYRVAQEALANIVRHAEASQASLIVLRHSDRATLLVEDDGRGFEPGTVGHGAGLGLVGMAERIALLDGSFHVESQPDRGTTVRVEVPMGGPWPSDS